MDSKQDSSIIALMFHRASLAVPIVAAWWSVFVVCWGHGTNIPGVCGFLCVGVGAADGMVSLVGCSDFQAHRAGYICHFYRSGSLDGVQQQY